MHDETFFVTRGKLVFWAPGEPRVEVSAGEMVVVPTHAPHTFENAGDEEAEVLSTFTPAHYVHYFRTMVEGDDDVPVFERARRAQAEWATMPAVAKKQ
jgi:quercetin dioxygenase-like cupin family protein